MINESRMEQHYAVSKSGVLLHINDAHESNEDCFCPYCGCRMLKKCGNIRTWHFAHDYRYENEVNKECSYESYLHEYAKLRLKQWFEESPSIMLYYNQPAVCKFLKDCKWKDDEDICSRTIEKSVDLKKCLTDCQIEETVHVNDDRFRADLYWSNPSKPDNNILVEIKVTHECTQKKKRSNARIIEFEVYSEEDVEKIVSSDIRESETVHFYGFNPPEEVDDDIPARHQLAKFVFYDSGKAYASSKCDCKTYMERRRSALMEVTIEDKTYSYGYYPMWVDDGTLNFTFGRFYNWGISLAKEKGCKVRNCYLCKHHKYDFDEDVLTCELRPDEECETKDALHCDKFCEDEETYQKNITEFNKFAENNLVDIWRRPQ